MNPAEVRNDWTLAEVRALFDLPFMDLVFGAQEIHRAFHRPNSVRISTLLSIKTGACPRGLRLLPAERAFRYRA